MRKNLVLVFASLVFSLLASSVNAGAVCAGKIGYLGMDQAGQVAVATNTGIATICSSTNQGSFQINPGVCKTFYATLLAAKLADKSVTIYYNSPALTSCSQIGMWSTQYSAYFIDVL